MPKQRLSEEAVSEISVNPQPGGLRAVYLVETRSHDETREIGKIFDGLRLRMRVEQLSKGKLVSFVVQADQADEPLLDELEGVLKASYGFVVTHRSFDDLIYRIVKELCEDTGSKLLPIPHCNICGKTEPFPNTVVSLSDQGGDVLLSRSYCGSCTAAAVAPSNKEFVRSLLAADKRDFGHLEQAEFVRRPSRKQPMRFKIKTSAG